MNAGTRTEIEQRAAQWLAIGHPARVAGLVFGGYPGAPKSLRQLQASSSLFFEVFRKYDAGNRLLGQAESEVLSQELELGRLRDTLQRLAALPLETVVLKAPSPFSLPLMVERLREQLSTEKMKDRLDRMLADAEAGRGSLTLARLHDAARTGEPGPCREDADAAMAGGAIGTGMVTALVGSGVTVMVSAPNPSVTGVLRLPVTSSSPNLWPPPQISSA